MLMMIIIREMTKSALHLHVIQKKTPLLHRVLRLYLYIFTIYIEKKLYIHRIYLSHSIGGLNVTLLFFFLFFFQWNRNHIVYKLFYPNVPRSEEKKEKNKQTRTPRKNQNGKM
ncbi:hypothetical protein BDV23DRAFT_94520 [Aspergillus alliaceus]|uniref:Uncharacterized protein n=1 Tax=Petromyces alliaceus TaxID=209559 RepID=A0A5N7C6K0_PETAA|nr:hypothetical protein BDV23DRAFT_94520 [Aspergillus alliaceus]